MTQSPPEAPPPAPRRSFVGALAVFGERRVAIMLGLGFAAGLPNFLIFDTMSAWLRAAGLSLAVISLFSLATLPYSFKFLWAPLVDRTAIPGLTRWLGHRRSWMLAAQAGVILSLLLISTGDPAHDLRTMALFAVLAGFCSATQDIVVDAWRIEAADASRQGAMAAAYQWGYRVANIVAGAAPLFLADRIGWRMAYAIMAAVMALGPLAVLGAPREAQHAIRPVHTDGVPARPALDLVEWLARLALLVLAAALLGSGLGARADLLAGALRALGDGAQADALAKAWTAKPNGVWLQLLAVLAGFAVIGLAASPIPRVKTRPGVYLFHALGDPLVDFFRRFGRVGWLILALICLYRLSDFVLNIMNAFYQDLGFSLTDIAEVRKVFGVAASMVGVFIGGLSVARLGVMRSLIIGAFALPITNTIFGWLATQGPSMPALFTAIGIDNVVSSYAGTCLIAYMSSLTSAGFTATQYALFSSLYSLPGKLLASQSGRIVEGAAQAAEGSGPLAPLRGLFAATPPQAFASALAKSHVDPGALGAGYVTFFLYSGAVGIGAMILTLLVARLTPGAERARETVRI
ncbi:AmpG family muropeptide MFS transporter [Caulobacter sp. KR2-114]|uniref:AmpG family muropeptide MFS transporter n=1 Tax=Caulobacter sp. KR2-114 TaxID=3400912 RepID=UPI003BFCF0D0